MTKAAIATVAIAGVFLAGLGYLFSRRRERATAGNLPSREEIRRRLMAAEPATHYIYAGGNIAGATPEWSAWFESLGPLSDQEFFQVWGMTREESAPMEASF